MPSDLDGVKKACEGILYPSESDYPLEIFEWDGTASDALSAVEDHIGDLEIEEISRDQFFTDLAGGDVRNVRVASLKALVGEHLARPRVFRVGRVEVQIFLVGRSHSGHWAGIRTVSVET